MSAVIATAESPAGLAPLGPGTLTVLVDLTNRCNLQCRMCYFSFPEVFNRAPIFISTRTFRSVADQCFPHAGMVVLSAGSEPLLHPRFEELLAIAAGHAPPHLRFLTNAQLLDARVAEATIRHRVSEVHVSVDGATRETYEWVRRGASFERLVANLERLAGMKRAAGSSLPVLQFNVTLMRRNVGELGELARLARRLGVEQVACRHLMPYEGLTIEDQSLSLDPEGANRALASGLAQLQAEGLRVVMFPDRFSPRSRREPPWWEVRPERPDLARAGWPSRPAVSFGPTPAIRQAPGATEPPPPGRRSGPATPRGDLAVPSAPGSGSRLGLAALSPDARRGLSEELLERGAADRPAAPFGFVDEPVGGLARRRPGLLLAGWALHEFGLARVTVSRERWKGEGPQVGGAGCDELGLVHLGDATFHEGSRPDVAARFPGLPGALRAGWSFRLRKQDLEGVPADIELRLHVVAWGLDGRVGRVGQVRLAPDDGLPQRGELYCHKPFSALYVDAAGNAYPYPDCQNVEPFGSFAEGATLASIWHGEALAELRRRIIEVDPPGMCRACPDFINRHPDDPDYFAPRRVASVFRLPHGHVDAPADGTRIDGGRLVVAGWACGPTRVLRVSVVIEPARGFVTHEFDARLGLPRPDVARAHPHEAGSGLAGFVAGVALAELPPGEDAVELRVLAHSAEGAVVEIGSIALRRSTSREAFRGGGVAPVGAGEEAGWTAFRGRRAGVAVRGADAGPTG